MKFFGSGSKKPSSSKKDSQSAPSTHSNANTNFEDRPQDSQPRRSEPSSPTKSHPKSPKKSSSSSRHSTYTESTATTAANNNSSTTTKTQRPSRSSRLSTDQRRSQKIDPNTHPLNLPPEERRRLSALAHSAMSGRDSMDVDREPVNGAVNGASSPSPKPSAQANFSVPIPNGTSHEEAPAPPPHSSNPSSPITTPADDAETYKAAGNRHFKEKNYPKAIEQYSKGLSCHQVFLVLFSSCSNICPSRGPVS